MACSRCGARRPVRQSDMPSGIRPGSNPFPAPNPASRSSIVPGTSVNDPKSVIGSLRYVPSK